LYIVQAGVLRRVRLPCSGGGLCSWSLMVSFIFPSSPHLQQTPPAHSALWMAWHRPWQEFCLHNCWVFLVAVEEVRQPGRCLSGVWFRTIGWCVSLGGAIVRDVIWSAKHFHDKQHSSYFRPACYQNQNSQWDPGVHQEECGQQVEGGYRPPVPW